MTSDNPIIRIRNLGFSYNENHAALHNITLDIAHGEFICVLGANGSGKSTLAKLINGLLKPTSGSVEVDGLCTSDKHNVRTIRACAGMVFQNPDDQIVATRVENDVAFGPENLCLPAETIKQRVSESLEAVGMSGFEKRNTATLSGGQKQRLAIAGTLAMHPRVLILDEATSMIDPRGRKGLLKICRELHKQGITLIMITHDIQEALHAERILILDKGHLSVDTTPQHLLSHWRALATSHLELPFSAELITELNKQGFHFETTLTQSQLEDALCQLHSQR